MNEHDKKQVKDFLAAVEHYLSCYKDACFSYLAVRDGEDFHLLRGRLQLQAVPVPKPSGQFQSPNVRAGLYRLNEMQIGPRDFIDSLLTGRLKTPDGELNFRPEEGRFHSAHFASYHPDGLTAQRRQMQLMIIGDRRKRFDAPAIDWELKAASTPYYDVQELCAEYLVGIMTGDFSTIEITALPVAAICTESTIVGGKARVGINVAEGLPCEKASIGFRVFENGRVIQRGTVIGGSLEWVSLDQVQRGTAEIEVPPAAIIDCIAIYDSVAQTHYWIADPKTAQNSLRAVHNAFDGNLEVLRELIERAQRKGEDARDLEMAISWLLWLLGFSPTRIGGTGKTSDAPDLIASTPLGHFIVIECTTGILREDSKLPHLYQRAEKVRQSLAAVGNRHSKILSVLVTTKSRDEVKAELEQAHKMGVLVATREDLPKLIERTMFPPDPNRLYAEAEDALRRLQNPPPFGLPQ